MVLWRAPSLINNSNSELFAYLIIDVSETRSDKIARIVVDVDGRGDRGVINSILLSSTLKGTRDRDKKLKGRGSRSEKKPSFLFLDYLYIYLRRRRRRRVLY